MDYANYLVNPLRDITTTVNSTLSSSAERTWQVMTGAAKAADDATTTTDLSVDTGAGAGAGDIAGGVIAMTVDEDDLQTPKPSSRAVDDGLRTLRVNDDYFRSPALSTDSPTSNPTTPTFERLQSKPTTALSLPEVHADNAPSPEATIASEAGSIHSLVPTMASGDNDVEGMLGEILSEEHARFPQLQVSLSDDDSSDGDYDDDPADESALDDEQRIALWRARRKHFFILSSAGKPVYSRYGDEGVVTQFMGVIQTIISFFQDGDDPLRSFTAGHHRFAILQEGHLYLVAISSMGESDAQLRTQLDALYTQVISTLTLTTVSKVFSEREGFDLRRLLGGTEVFLDGLSDAMLRGDPNILLGALECLKLRKHAREKINSALLKSRSSSSLLYGLIIADGRLVSVVRPKRHSLHPPDLQLFISMLFNATTFHGGGEHWTPICLPKFNAKGFLHAYITFFRPEVALVLICPSRDAFFEMQGVKEKCIEQLEKDGSVQLIEAAVKRGRYLVTDALPNSSLRHFLYKSRGNVQYTTPSFSPYYATPLARRKLMTLYQRLHATVHAKGAHLKVHHGVKGSGVSLAWVTPGFELYVVAARGVGREELAKEGNRVVQWVRREEERLFVVGGATF